MRSQLSRHVLRRCLTHSGGGGRPTIRTPPATLCRRQCAPRTPSHFPQQQQHRHQQRRSFFGIFQKAPRRIKSPLIDPGYEALLVFDHANRRGLRPPKTDVLVKAFKDLFAFKVQHSMVVNSNQADAARGLLKYLLEQGPGSDGQELLSLEDLRTAQKALARTPHGITWAHCDLARDLHAEITRRISGGQTDADKTPSTESRSMEDFADFVDVLTHNGGSLEAGQKLEEFWGAFKASGGSIGDTSDIWISVMQGLASEGKGDELLKVAAQAEKEGVQYGPGVQEAMTTFYAGQNDGENTKRWFYKPLSGGLSPTQHTFDEILGFSVRNKQTEWTAAYFKQLLESNPPKMLWDVIFQWAVACQGKGVEDISRMIDLMRQHNKEDPDVRPDIETINGLVSIAIAKKDHYLAERFLSMGMQMGIRPNARTFILQLDYRIDANDFSGSNAAYEALQLEDLDTDDDLPVINKYIRALCRSPSSENQAKILGIVEAVDDRQAILEPKTVVALCLSFLQSDLQHDLIDTLMVHTTTYSYDDRALVRKALVRYCLDTTNSTARVWDCYSLLQQFFGDTDLADRVRLMDAFFFRKRPDMACFVFGHMRAHSNETVRPTPDVYIRCLERLGQYPDQESLRLVHNMLKMDVTVQPSTRLYNALMIAYNGCGVPRQAFDFWKDITDSAEGPSYNSLEVVFWVCEDMTGGDGEARDIWQRLLKMEVEVPPQVYNAYAGAIASSGALQEVQALVQGMRAAVGEEPDMSTIAVCFNAIQDQDQKKHFSEWAAEHYPEQWNALEKKGKRRRFVGPEVFKMKRVMKA